MLTVENLSSGYNGMMALRSVDISISTHELVTVVGRNGAGKSTLLRAISGVQPITTGRILLNGIDITHMSSSRRVSLGIAHAPEGRQIFGDLSIEDNLILGGYCRRNRIRENLDKMYELFPVLQERRVQHAATLSGGQQQMLAIARALMAEPCLLMLDEPSMGLAPQMAAQIFKVIRALQKQGTAILLVEQNARAALAFADKAYLLESGAVVGRDTAAAMLDDNRVKVAYLGG